jgi:hypothetical protein
MTKPISFKPGRLMTAISAHNAGLGNYVVKRDFRRDMDAEVRGEGYDRFYPKTTVEIGNQHYPGVDSAEPINLLCMVRRANGQTAVLAGTKTTLYRFYAFEHGQYFADGYAQEGSEEEEDLELYVGDIDGEWIEIGTGFSEDGRRWEMVECGDYLVFNNSVDLPVTYQLQDYTVKPIWELRDQGIAYVNTIASINGILMCFGIAQIKPARVAAYLDTVNSGGSLGNQTVEGWVDSKDLAGGAGIRARVGHASVPSGVGNKMVLDAAYFNAGMVGLTVLFPNGLKAVIAAYTSSTQVTLAFASGATDELIEEFSDFVLYDADGANNDLVVSTKSFLGYEGQSIIWESGETRKIMEVLNPYTVRVDQVRPVAEGLFKLTNPLTYTAITNPDDVDFIPYRALWSHINPRQFAATMTGTIEAGDNILRLTRPVKWLNAGDSVLVLGAGTSGGNLTAGVVAVLEAGMAVVLDKVAATTAEDTLAENSAQVGGIVGYDDLADDGSAIVKALPIRGTLVVYKETMIFAATYTGQAGEAFKFQKILDTECVPAFRNAVIAPSDGRYHIYLTNNGFYRFDLVSQVPQVFEPLAVCYDIFYRNVVLLTQDDRDAVFAADNAITKELWLCFPSRSDDKAIRFDYKFGTVSTTSIDVTAAAMVDRPRASLTAHKERWFIMGTSLGEVLRYGRVDQPVVSGVGGLTAGTVTANAVFRPEHVGRTIVWADGTRTPIITYTSATEVVADSAETVAADTAFTIEPAIWHRSGANYTSVLKSGLGNPAGDGETKIVSYTPVLASQSPNAELDLVFFGARNPAETPVSLGTRTIALATEEPLVPMHLMAQHIQDQITVEGKDNPVAIAERVYRLSAANSKGFSRRQTS